jgi:hypothetical protein
VGRAPWAHPPTPSPHRIICPCCDSCNLGRGTPATLLTSSRALCIMAVACSSCCSCERCGACCCCCRCDRLSSPSLSSLYPFCTTASVTHVVAPAAGGRSATDNRRATVRCPHPRLPCGGKALPRSADAAADVGATRQTLRWCQRALAVPYSDAGIAGAPAAAYGAVRGGAPQRC